MNTTQNFSKILNLKAAGLVLISIWVILVIFALTFSISTSSRSVQIAFTQGIAAIAAPTLFTGMYFLGAEIFIRKIGLTFHNLDDHFVLLVLGFLIAALILLPYELLQVYLYTKNIHHIGPDFHSPIKSIRYAMIPLIRSSIFWFGIILATCGRILNKTRNSLPAA